MLIDSRLSIKPQLLGVIQPVVKLPMLPCHIPNGGDDLPRKKKKESEENHNIKPIFKTVEV